MSAQRRIEQIERTAVPVVPVDVGKWVQRKALPASPADMVLITPSDLAWLLNRARLR